jgi:hypothetical protein
MVEYGKVGKAVLVAAANDLLYRICLDLNFACYQYPEGVSNSFLKPEVGRQSFNVRSLQGF